MTLAAMLAQVRGDLKEPVASKWTDAELEAHIARALVEYSQACPLVGTKDKAATTSAIYDLSAETGYLWAIDAEWPIGTSERGRISVYEPIKGSVWLQLGDDELPTLAQNIRFYYAKSHSLGASSTIPPEHEPIVQIGAVGFALSAYAVYSVDRIATTGASATDWRLLANSTLSQFRDELARVHRRPGAGFARWGDYDDAWHIV